jgi:hypothetical protein
MATKEKDTPTVHNTLGKLVLEHLDRAGGRPLPETTIRTSLANMVVPPADEQDFTNTFQLLVTKEVVRFEEDHVSGERKFFLTPRGRTYCDETFPKAKKS